jgi:phosphoribosyl-AMP cyclohydrolase
MQTKVFNSGANRYLDIVHSHMWAYSSSSGERHVRRLLLVDCDPPCVEPYVQKVKMSLEMLGRNQWIRMRRD